MNGRWIISIALLAKDVEESDDVYMKLIWVYFLSIKMKDRIVCKSIKLSYIDR